MLIIENIKLALTSIRTNKMRSFLTMLGIIIGISSVISITSIGASAKGAVSSEFDAIGKSNIYIALNWQVLDDDDIENEMFFSREDVDALRERFPDEVRYAALWNSVTAELKMSRTTGKLNIQGVGADYDQFVKSNKIIYGRMPNQKDIDRSTNTIVIGKDAAMHFFNKENVVGQVIGLTVGEPKDYTIIGVYEKEASLFDGMMRSDSYNCFAPYTSLQRYPDERSSILDIHLDPERDAAQVSQQLVNYMAKVKRYSPETYYFETAEGQLGQINQVLGILSIAIGAIAAISLVVGGIGIMNIMLVSVTERTKEIGIRKSLGARTKDIMFQFLIESMIVSAIGGIIGTLLGVGIASIGMSLAGIAAVVEPGIIVTAVVFSALVGMFFGLYPASKAAKLDPIEALRYE